MKLVTLFTLATPTLVSGRTVLPKDNKNAWQSKIKKEVHGFYWEIYANGKGRYEKPGQFKCSNKWRNAVTYGAQEKEIIEFCVRLHENEHDKEPFKRSPSVYRCILDPNDDGNDHGKKDRDWLCYEKVPRYVLLPPHGIDLASNCSDQSLENYAPKWYPNESPPEWCTYNWYADYQTCWCMKGYYRTSPHDTSLHMRACPPDTIIIKPVVESTYEWLKERHPVTAPATEASSTTTTTTPAGASTNGNTPTEASRTTATTITASTSTTTGTTPSGTTTITTLIITSSTASSSATSLATTRTEQTTTVSSVSATSTTIESTPASTPTASTSKRCICPSPTSSYFETTDTIIQTTSSPTTVIPTVAVTTTSESTSISSNTTSGYTATPDGRNPRVGVPTDNPNNTDCGEHGIWSSITQSCVCDDGWETVGSEPCNTLSTSDDENGFGELASNNNESSGSGGIIIAIVLVVIIVAIACYLMWRFYKHRSFSLSALRLPTLSKPRRFAGRELSESSA